MIKKVYNYGQLHFLYVAYIAILSNSHTQYVPPKRILSNRTTNRNAKAYEYIKRTFTEGRAKDE